MIQILFWLGIGLLVLPILFVIGWLFVAAYSESLLLGSGITSVFAGLLLLLITAPWD